MNNQRNIFIVTVAHDSPNMSQLTIAARDEEHARELVMEGAKRLTNVNIVDIVCFADFMDKQMALHAFGLDENEINDVLASEEVQEQIKPKVIN